jgi:hypothetical protein
VLDGVRITEREKTKAEAYLREVLDGVKERVKESLKEREKMVLRGEVSGKAVEDHEGERTEVVVRGRVREWVEKVEGVAGHHGKHAQKRKDHEREKLKAASSPVPRVSRDGEKKSEHAGGKERVDSTRDPANRSRKLAAPSAEKDMQGAQTSMKSRSGRRAAERSL